MTNRTAQKGLIGKRIRLLHTSLDTPLRAGALGLVKWVDDLGQVTVDWDSGHNDVLSWTAGDRWVVVPGPV